MIMSIRGWDVNIISNFIYFMWIFLHLCKNSNNYKTNDRSRKRYIQKYDIVVILSNNGDLFRPINIHKCCKYLNILSLIARYDIYIIITYAL